MHTKIPSRLTLITALVAAATLALAGCAATTEPLNEPATAGESVTITDAWVKTADEGMTAAFGEIVNTSSSDITLLSASTAAAGMMELHETVDDGTGTMSMQERDGGFSIPAGSSLTLEPGGNHLMLMGLTAPILAGDEVSFTLAFSDGSEFAFTAPAKDYSGANENYVGDGMDMEGDD